MSGNAQPAPAQPRTENNQLYQFSLAHPILVPLALLAIAVVLRIVDIGILRLDEKWGEALMHKALGFVMVLLYVWAAGRSVQEIGLHGRHAGKAMLITGLGTVVILALGFGLQWVVSSAAGKQPQFTVAATDPKEGKAGGLLFALFLVTSNFVNSFMEDGLFRGVMLRHFRVRLSPWQANLLQAVLFAAWHLVRPAKHLLLGKTDLAGFAGEAGMIFVGAGIVGFVWGYLYLKTDSLWAPWLSHTINNSASNLLHIRTIDGLDANQFVFHGVVLVAFLAFVPLAKVWAKRLRMPEVSPWGT